MQVKDKRKSRRGVGVLALVCLVCHLALAPNIALGNGHANFALVFAEVVALSVGGPTGVLCGFLGGLVYDLSSTGPIGLMAFLLTAAAYPLGMEVHDRIGEDPGFRVAVVLPKGTNTEKPEILPTDPEDRLLWARNKWLLAHPESAEAAHGAYVGLTGENLDISI